MFKSDLLVALLFLPCEATLARYMLSSCVRPSESEILKILSTCPNKQSDSDLVPIWLLK